MRRGLIVLCAACAGVLMATGVAYAQGGAKAQGWPGASKPAAAPKAVVAVKPAATARPVAASKAPAAVAETSAKPAAPVVVGSAPADLVRALQEQSALLARLASEIERDRQVIADQQRAIQALSEKAAAPAPVAAAAKPAAPAPPPPAITVDTAGTKMRISGLVQGWYSASDGATVDTFRIRRTELKVSGDISPKARWAFMLDPVKTSAPLQDAVLTVQPSPAFAIEVGQQKLPLSFEGTQSSGKLDTIERALFITEKSRGAGYGDQRDLGLMVRGKAAKGQVEYAAGVFNGLGESINDTDKNEDKAFAARGFYKPSAVKGLQVGASVARGALRSTDATRRDRQGLEASYTRGAFMTRGEFMAGVDGLVPRRGYYAMGAFRVARPVQVLFRADVWDPDTRDESRATTVAERDWLAGVNWQVAGPGVLVQLNYVRKTFADIQAPRNVVLANIQTAW